jgi:BolA family transcriptional regulator, general stress-responsive regulator
MTAPITPPHAAGQAPEPTAIETQIRDRLAAALAPLAVDIVNESHLHAGHRSSPGTGDSHFRVRVVADKFTGLSRVARQRLVNQALAPLIGKPIHALAMEALTPSEATTG